MEIYRGNGLDFSGYVTSLVTLPFDTPGSHRCSTVIESLSPVIDDIMGHKHIEVTT